MTRAHAPASCQQQDFGVVQAFFQQILHDLLDDQRAHEGVATCTQRKQSEDGERPANEAARGFAFASAAPYSAPFWGSRRSTRHWSSTGRTCAPNTRLRLSAATGNESVDNGERRQLTPCWRSTSEGSLRAARTGSLCLQRHGSTYHHTHPLPLHHHYQADYSHYATAKEGGVPAPPRGSGRQVTPTPRLLYDGVLLHKTRRSSSNASDPFNQRGSASRPGDFHQVAGG